MVFPIRTRSRSTPCVRVLVGSAAWAAASRRSKFLLNQGRLLQQPYHLGPDNLVQQVLPHGARVASGTAEVPPSVRSDAAVVLDLAGACPGRRARQRVAALLTTDQPLDQARFDRAPRGMHLVLVEQFLGACEGRLVHDRGHRNLDPFLARAFVIRTIATRGAAAQP